MDNGSRYVGLDVHRDTISVAVCDSRGKLMLERVIPTSAAAVLELVELLRDKLHVAFEEGTSAQWLAGLLQPHVAQVLVCDPRKNDRRGARMIASMRASWPICCGRLSPVFHQDCGLTALQELARTYLVPDQGPDPGNEPYQRRSGSRVIILRVLIIVQVRLQAA